MASTRAVRAATRATRTAASSRSVRSAGSAGCGGVRSMVRAPAIGLGRPGPGSSPGPPQGQRLAAVLVADRAQPAAGAALAAGLAAGAGQLPAAGRAAGDPDAAQQVQGRLRMGVGRVGLRVHPRDLLTGLVVREAGTGHSRPGLTAGWGARKAG